MFVEDIINQRACCVRSLSVTSNWKLVCNLADSPDKVCANFSMENGTINFFDWVCEHCCLGYANDQRLTDQLDNDKLSVNPIIARRSKLIEKTLATLKSDGLVFTKLERRHDGVSRDFEQTGS